VDIDRASSLVIEPAIESTGTFILAAHCENAREIMAARVGAEPFPTRTRPSGVPLRHYSSSTSRHSPAQQRLIDRCESTTALFTADSQDARSTPRKTTHERPSSSLLPRSYSSDPTNTNNALLTETVRSRIPPSTKDLFSPSQADSAYSYFSPRPQSSAEPRSPWPKRPPASHSSHGVETLSGPPPAIITQRGVQGAEHVWQFSPQDIQLKLTHIQTQKAPAELISSNHRSPLKELVTDTEAAQQVQPPVAEAASGVSKSVVTASGQRQEMSTFIPQMLRKNTDGSTHSRGDGYRTSLTSRPSTSHGTEARPRPSLGRESGTSEDLFLALARSNEEDMVQTPPASHRTRLWTPLSRLRQPTESPPSQSRVTRDFGMPKVLDRGSSLRQNGESPRGYEERAPRTALLPPANYGLENGHRRRVSDMRSSLTQSRTDHAKESSPDVERLASRHPSATEAGSGSTARAYGRSQLSSRASNLFRSSPIIDRHGSMGEVDSPAAGRIDGPGSVLSTAQSTVWDELHGLKSRIKRLESTGRLPPSSEAAIAAVAGERPQTATTTTTTMSSSSPKRSAGGPSISPITSTGFEETTTLHSLLHSALTTSKAHVEPGAHYNLVAAANDALALAKLASSLSQPGASPSSIDRQLKRKADNMCRSLTELCISLSSSAPSRPISSHSAEKRHRTVYDNKRDSQLTATMQNYLQTPEQKKTSANVTPLDEPQSYFPSTRANSLEPDSSVTARAFSRLAARRSSMLGLNPHSPINAAQPPTASLSRQPSLSPNRHPDSYTQDPHSDTTTPTQTQVLPAHSSSGNAINSSPASAVLARSSTVLSRVRRTGTGNDNGISSSPIGDRLDGDNTIRPLSRARTELVHKDSERMNALRARRISREYTSQHPLPPSLLSDFQQQSPSESREAGTSSQMKYHDRDAEAYEANANASSSPNVNGNVNTEPRRRRHFNVDRDPSRLHFPAESSGRESRSGLLGTRTGGEFGFDGSGNGNAGTGGVGRQASQRRSYLERSPRERIRPSSLGGSVGAAGSGGSTGTREMGAGNAAGRVGLAS